MTEWWCCTAPYGEHDDNCPNKEGEMTEEEDRNTEDENISEEGEFEECEGWCNIHGEDNGGVYSTGRLL